MTKEILETLKEMQGERTKDKIVAVLETAIASLPPTMSLLVKYNLNLVMRYVDDVPDEEIEAFLTDVHRIVFLIEGVDYETVIDADEFVPEKVEVDADGERGE